MSIPTLDDLASQWTETRALCCYPSLSNFVGGVKSSKRLGAFQNFYAVGRGASEQVNGTIYIDDQPVLAQRTRWFAYQILNRAKMNGLEIESSMRMAFEQRELLIRLTLTNTMTHPHRFQLRIDRPDERLAYQFDNPPDATGCWNIELKPSQIRSMLITVTFGPEMNSPGAFEDVQRSWERQWQCVFTNGNSSYSGSLPALEFEDREISELYYLSILSFLQTQRNSVFPTLPHVFVTNTPEWNRRNGYFWDMSVSAQLYALLDPANMKQEMRLWLAADRDHGNAIDYTTGQIVNHWYAVNCYAIFQTLHTYISTTNDFEFLSERIAEKSVLAHLDALATDWRQRVDPQSGLADYGPDPWSFFECVPDYKHMVASYNAANVWMMRVAAQYHDRAGNSVRANELRQLSRELLPRVLALYRAGDGTWDVLHPDGQRIESRHSYDFFTVGQCIGDDLSPQIRQEMMAFLERELLTETWMRAMSWRDPATEHSDRSDHGPAGSYTAWPALAAQTVAEFGYHDKALDLLRRFRLAFKDAAIGQAVELVRIPGQPDWQTRIGTRCGASFCTCSGAFACAILKILKLGRKL
jgi:hypothetical protein